jgi:hypothetical protein
MGWGINVGVLVFAILVGRGIAALFRARARDGYALSSGGPDPALARTVEELQNRVAELEERLDFAERMLATQRDGERLGAPKS